jgi:hypothetical protein
VSAWPRDIDLDIAAMEHGDPPPTKELAMSSERKCSKCSGAIGPNNRIGICTPCQRPNRGAGAVKVRGHAKPDADDAVLGRLAEDLKPPPPAEPETSPWLKQFYQLAEALGLNPDDMLAEHCRQWVENVRAKALGEVKPSEAPAGE